MTGLIAENIAEVAPEYAIYEDDMKTPKSYRLVCFGSPCVVPNYYSNAYIAHQLNEHGQITAGTYCSYSGTALGTWTGSPTTNITISSPSGAIAVGQTVTDALNSGITGSPATTVTAYNSSTGAMTLSANTKTNKTNDALTFSGFLNCSTALNTGTTNGDFEQVLDNGANSGDRYQEIWPVNAPQISTIAAIIAGKSMFLPH